MRKQYCKAKNKKIIDQYGEELLLKGVGIGGWLLLEGYMIQSHQSLDRPRRIKEYIATTINKEYMNDFFETWFLRFFQTNDILHLKEEGFNCIRIPLDYEFLFTPSTQAKILQQIPHHFAILDNIIDACKQQQIYVILDLHAAPGGQTGTNIDNSWDDLPRLFLEPLYQNQTINIWKDLAKRYKDEEWIVAYDLLNEPLPNWFGAYNDQLLPLYKKIIKAIRLVDANHMITLEGLHWSTDLSVFTSLPDDNILLQFHKYWSSPDIESIQEYLDLRDKLACPLIMGEGGENNLLWYSAVFKLYQQLDISYAFWTYKKMEANNSITSFDKPQAWDAFLEHKLTKEEAKDVLDSLLINIDFEQTRKNKLVANHVMNKDTFRIPAYAFDFYGEGLSYQKARHHDSSIRQQDGMQIANIDKDTISPDFKQYNGEEVPKEKQLYLFLQEDESVTYTFYASTDQDVLVNIECDQPNHMKVLLNQHELFSYKNNSKVTVKKGGNIIKIYAHNKVRLANISFQRSPNIVVKK